MKQIFGWMAVAMVMGMTGTAAADQCSACNGFTKPEVCCRKLAGCETYMSEQAGQNFCRASKAAPAAKLKVSAAECNRNYNTCIRGVTSRSSKFKSTTVNGKKLSRADVAAALRADRAQCQSRLKTCRRMVNP